MRFPTLDEVITCNEAVRERSEVSPSADDDEFDRVGRALQRASTRGDPIDVAAALAFEIAAAQGFYEGNKRTALVIARWFLRENTEVDPATVILADDRELGDLLIKAARGEDVLEQIRDLLRART